MSQNEQVPVDENERRQQVLKLIGKMRCQSCGRRYRHQSFTLVQKWPDSWVLKTRCRHCEADSHVIVFMQLDANPDYPTDLCADEMEVANDWAPISSDDVLDIHTFLGAFEGGFEEIFTS